MAQSDRRFTLQLFIAALLDIQIVASSLQDIGGGLSAAQDEIAWAASGRLLGKIFLAVPNKTLIVYISVVMTFLSTVRLT